MLIVRSATTEPSVSDVTLYETVPVTGDERFPDRRRHGASGAPDVEHLGGAVRDDAADVAVAHQPVQRRPGEPAEVFGVAPHGGDQLGVTAAFELGQIDHHADVGPHPAGGADLARLSAS